MNNVTVQNYREDKLYPRVVQATARILAESDDVSPVAILIQMGNITPSDHDSWQRGKVPYLEQVFQGSLSKANRILRLIGFHVHDLKMIPSQHTYRQLGAKKILRFSKSGIVGVEAQYSMHFRWNQSPEKKQTLVERTMSEQTPAGDVLKAAPEE